MYYAKTPAKCVQAILYLPDGMEDQDAYQHALHDCEETEWQLVSLNASIYTGATPQHPESMARNQMGLVGGSDATYTTEQWAESVLFWGCHVQCRPADGHAEPDYWA